MEWVRRVCSPRAGAPLDTQVSLFHTQGRCRCIYFSILNVSPVKNKQQHEQHRSRLALSSDSPGLAKCAALHQQTRQKALRGSTKTK